MRLLGALMTALTIAVLTAGAALAEPADEPAPGEATEPSGLRLGFHQDLGYLEDRPAWTPRLEAARAMGATVSRGIMQWSVIEPAEGRFEWDRYDELVSDMQAHGMAPVFFLAGSPTWANGSADPLVVPAGPAFAPWKDAFVQFAAAVAQHFRGLGLRYEIWNEPNEYHFWRGSAPSVDRYASLFSEARAAMLAQDPGAQIAVGGLAGLTASCCITGRDFLADLIDRDVSFDYVAIHPYSDRRGPYEHVRWRQNFDDTVMIHELLEARGRTGVKLWLTEWGWSSSEVGEAAQAQFVQQSIDRIRSEWAGFVDIATYFLDADTPRYGHGLLRSDMSPKPAAAAFRASVAR
jgi:hypothetical protein